MSTREWPTENLRREWEWDAYLPPCLALLWGARSCLSVAAGLGVADELLGDVPLGWFAVAAILVGMVLYYRAYRCKE